MSAKLEPAAAEGALETIEAPEAAAGNEHSPANPTTEPAAPDADNPAKGESVHDYLMRNLIDGNPTDATTPAAEPATKEEPPKPQDKEPAETEKPAEIEATQEPSNDPADPKPSNSTSSEEPKETPSQAADTDAIKIVTRDEIEEQFKRAPKEIRDIAANNAEVALRLQKQIETDFGGEHMAEPMRMIAKGLLEDDNVPIIHGVLNAQGVDGFTGLMKDFLTVALIDAPKADPKDEGNRYFAKACEGVADELFKARFGDNATPGLIEKLLKYESDGLLNTSEIDEYYKEGGEGSLPNPVVKQLQDEKAELERQLAETKATETDKQANAERQFADAWTGQLVEESTQSLEDLYFKTSVLKPVEGDAAEIKAAKAQIKTLVLDAATAFQKADPKFKSLQAAAYRGNSETAKYRREKSQLVENTVFHAKKLAAPIEALISQVYTLGRNANIPAAAAAAAAKAAASAQPPDARASEPKAPTQTTEAKKEPMTLDEWNKHMTQVISGM